MKMMLNGAVTLGTMDGANVEIAGLVGSDNIYIFGRSSDEVIRLCEEGSYSPWAHCAEDPLADELTGFIVSKQLLRIGDAESLSRLYADLTRVDWFMALPDLRDYIETKERMLSDYTDRHAWARKSLLNIAGAGFFSSDRAAREYNRDIWKL
jgi:starch phosphorylase